MATTPLSIKSGWIYSAQQLATKIDPSATNLSNSKVAELIKSGKYTTEIQLAIAAGIDASAINVKTGWTDSFNQTNKKVDP